MATRPHEVITVDPAAGTEISYTAVADMIVHSLRFTLSTDATVANRQIILIADDGTDVFFEAPCGAAQAASLTKTYGAFDGSVPSSDLSGRILIGFPTNGLFLRKDDRIRTFLVNGAGGDNRSAMTMQVEYL